MNFKVSSASLLTVLQNTSKAIAPKTTMPILDHFLFVVEGNVLTVTASDIETTIVSTIEVDSVEESGSIAIPSRLILESLRVLSDQPFNISTNGNNNDILLQWATGDIVIPGLDSEGYPQIVSSLPAEDKQSITLTEEQLYNGILKTHFAASTNESRASLNCVLMDITPMGVTFVATDAHQLSKISYPLIESNDCSNMVMIPRKAAFTLKGLLQKVDTRVTIDFSDRTIIFNFSDYTFVCRMIEGRYPNYNSVIPENNDIKVYIDRVKLLASLKMMAICCNQGNKRVKATIANNKVYLEVKDVDFSTSAKDSINCSYDGEEVVIGLDIDKAIDMLSVISAPEVTFAFSSAGKAALLTPTTPARDEESLVMLLMPSQI